MNTPMSRIVWTLAIIGGLVASVSPAWGQTVTVEIASGKRYEIAGSIPPVGAVTISQRDYDALLGKATSAAPFTLYDAERCAICPGLKVGVVCRVISRAEYEAQKRAALERARQIAEQDRQAAAQAARDALLLQLMLPRVPTAGEVYSEAVRRGVEGMRPPEPPPIACSSRPFIDGWRTTCH